MTTYRKLPTVVEAVQYDGHNHDEIETFLGRRVRKSALINESIFVPTLHGLTVANQGDYIIRGEAGDFWPCKPDIFEKTYEEIHVWNEDDVVNREHAKASFIGTTHGVEEIR